MPVHFPGRYVDNHAGRDDVFFTPGRYDAFAIGNIKNLFAGMGVEIKPRPLPEMNLDDAGTSGILVMDQHPPRDLSFTQIYYLVPALNFLDVLYIGYNHNPPVYFRNR